MPEIKRSSPRIPREHVLALIDAAAGRDHARARRTAIQIAAHIGEPHADRIRKAFEQAPELPHELQALWMPRRIEEKPWYPDPVERGIACVLDEIQFRDAIIADGLVPLVRVLLSGPPGCGKTMTGAWLARHLGVPAYVLSLAETIHSYMGQTGATLAKALLGAAVVPGVWILDELDSVAQRRIGSADGSGREYNAVVNTLCVTMDTLGVVPGGLILATTNRLDVLDPAIVRRFDAVIEWPEPTGQLLAAFSVALGYEGLAASYADVSTGAARQRRERVIARAKGSV